MADKKATVEVELKADATDAEKGLKKVAIAASEVSKEIKETGEKSAHSGKKLNELGNNANEAAKNLDNLDKKISNSTTDIKQLEDAVSSSKEEIKNLGTESEETIIKIQKLNEITKKTNKECKDIGNQAESFGNKLKNTFENSIKSSSSFIKTLIIGRKNLINVSSEYIKQQAQEIKNTNELAEAQKKLEKDLFNNTSIGQNRNSAVKMGKFVLGNFLTGSALNTTYHFYDDLITRGGKLVDKKNTYTSLGGNTNTIDNISNILRGIVSKSSLYSIANKGLLANIPDFEKNFENIAIQSRKLASTLGLTVPEAMEKFVDTIVAGNIAQLGRYGVIIKTKQAEEEYAITLGKSRNELTSQEKMTAKITAAFESLANVVNEGEIPAENVNDSWKRLQTTIEDIKDSFGENLISNDIFKQSIDEVTEKIKKMDFDYFAVQLSILGSTIASVIETILSILNAIGNSGAWIIAKLKGEEFESPESLLEQKKLLEQKILKEKPRTDAVAIYNNIKAGEGLYTEEELKKALSGLIEYQQDELHNYSKNPNYKDLNIDQAALKIYNRDKKVIELLKNAPTVSDYLKKSYLNMGQATKNIRFNYNTNLNKLEAKQLTYGNVKKELDKIELTLLNLNKLKDKLPEDKELTNNINEITKIKDAYLDLQNTLPRTAGGLAGISREEREAQRKSEQLRKEIERMHNQWDSYIDSWESNSLSQQLEEALNSNNIEEFEKIREVQLQKKLAEFENTYQEYVEKGIITQIEFENQRHEIEKEHNKETAKMEEENAQHLVEIYANAFDNISNIIGKTLDDVFGNYNFSNLFDTFNSQLSNSTKDSFLNPIAEFFGADTSTKEGRESFAASMNSIFSTFSSSVSQIMSANSTKEENQAIGGAIGAGIGTAIGTVLGGLPGAALGAAIGNTAGNIIGSKINSGNNKDKESRKAFQWALEDLINENKTFMLKDLQSGKWESFLAAGKADFEIISTEAFNEYLKKSQSGFNKITHAAVNSIVPTVAATVGLPAAAGLEVAGASKANQGEYKTSNRLDWSAAYWEQVSNVANDAFLGIGNAYVGLIEDCEEIGSQFAAMLAHNLGNSVDNIRAFVYETGMSLEDMQESLMNLALKGDITWHEWAVSMQGLETAFGEGLEAEGDLAGAWDQFIASAGRGKAALLGLKNIAIEAGEAGITSIAGLGDYLKNLGISAESVDGLLSALAQSGIQTIEELKNAEDGVLGQIIAGTQSMSNDVASIWSELNNQINDVQDALNNIPEQVHSDVVINVQTAMDAAAREDLKLLKTVTSDGTITIPDNSETTATIGHAAGGVFTRPTIIGGHLFGEAGDELLMPLDRYLSSLDIQDRTPKTIINIDARGASEGVEQNLRVIFEEMGDMIIQQAVDAAVSTVGGY